MMPGRYAKFEQSSGLLVSIDRYAYRAPRIAAPEPQETEGESARVGEEAPEGPGTRPSL